MNSVLQYNISLLNAICTFLSSEPIIYIFGFLLLIIVVKFFLTIIGYKNT